MINSNGIVILSLLILVLAIFIDIILGELPIKIHPVVFIGNSIDFFLKYLLKFRNKWSGSVLTIFTLLSVILLFFIILYLARFNDYVFIILSSIILSSTFSIRMLLESAKSIKNDLNTDLNLARKSISYFVSRNTNELDETLIISATIETLSENIIDSVISPIFYYILGTLIIALFFTFNIFNFVSIRSISIFNNELSNSNLILILLIIIPMIYRVINTLDAMVGYKNEKYFHIGHFPANLDDILNYIPARISGFLVVIASFLLSKSKFDWKNSYNIMKRDSKNSPSPNSGFTMAGVAGALNISLKKKDVYNIGDNGKKLKKDDIVRAIKLSKLTIFLFVIISILILLFFK